MYETSVEPVIKSDELIGNTVVVLCKIRFFSFIISIFDWQFLLLDNILSVFNISVMAVLSTWLLR